MNAQLLPTEPRSWRKNPFLDTKHPIFVKNIQMLPKKYQRILAQKYLFLVQNYAIHSKKNPVITNSTTFCQKTLIPAKKNAVLAKISQYLPHKETRI